MTMRSASLALPVAAALMLGGCIRFGAEPPAALLSLHPEAQATPGEVRSTVNAGTIAILVPSAPQEVAVSRVPVRSADTSIAYVRDAVWVEPPTRLFARMLADTIGARTGRVVLSRRESLTAPGAMLSGELRSFGIEAARVEAVVTYDASLIRTDNGPVEKRRFEARVPVAPVDAATVGPALNRAANQVAGEVAEWVGR